MLKATYTQMTHFCNHLGLQIFYFVLVVLTLFGTSGLASQCPLQRVELQGAQRTNREWLLDYLGFEFPGAISDEQLTSARRKLLTTDVFVNVELIRAGEKKDCFLLVVLHEKWTTIPVIRGSYGGGTPLLVGGGYDTHVAGKLYTVGGEFRRYGGMPTGWLLYGKAPRLRGGNLSLGVEVWRDRRRRDFYEADGTHAGYTKSDAQIVKSQILYPLLVGRLQAGLHVESAWEQPSTFQSEGGERPLSIVLNNSKQQSYQALPMMVLDTIYIEGLSYEGVRLSGKWGPQFAPGGERNRVAEGEFFGFVSATNDLSLASHLYLGSTTSRTLKNTFFLGGFDSVRGLPDGIHFGNQLAYGNSEIRHRGLEWKYLHMQHVLFADAGSAFFDSKEAKENFEWSTGVGLRFAVPQVYRLMLRIDYAWSLGSTRSQGISAGLNHFFQPYKLVY